VCAYDPKALKEARTCLGERPRLVYAENKYAAVDGADAMILITEWKEFRSPDFARLKNALKTPVIFDGRNQYDFKTVENFGFEYWPIGRRPVRCSPLSRQQNGLE
jgi:UDPglucose 6-dehydrogenase